MKEIFKVDVNKGREVIYACLSRIFLDVPNDKTYDMLDNVLQFLTPVVDSLGDKMMKNGVEGLDAFLKKRKQLQGKSLEEFDEETNKQYTRLFALTDSIPLSESVFVSPDNLTMQESTGIVNKIYKKTGFDMKHYSNEPADHISFELMFMSYLAKSTAKAADDGNVVALPIIVKNQVEFINSHLLNWFPFFVEMLRRYDMAKSLYLPAAYLTHSYIIQDKVMLEG